MAITRTPMVDDDGTGTTGTVINNAWKQQFYDQIDAALPAPLGAWTDVAYAAANYTASTGTWTMAAGGQQNYLWLMIGKVVYLHFWISPSTTSAATTELRIAIPAAVPQAFRSFYAPILGMNGTTALATPIAVVRPSDARIHLQMNLDGTVQFPATTTLGVAGQLIYAVA